MSIHRTIRAIAVGVLLLTGCSADSGRTPVSPLADAPVLEPLTLRLVDAFFQRAGPLPVRVEQIEQDRRAGIKVDGQGISWRQREQIRFDNGAEVLAGWVKVPASVTKTLPRAALEAWFNSLDPDSSEDYARWRDWALDESLEVPTPSLRFAAVFIQIPPRGTGEVFKIHGYIAGEYEMLEGDPILASLAARYQLDFRVSRIPDGKTSRFFDESASQSAESAEIQLKVQVIASTSRRWQPDEEDPTPCLVWESSADPQGIKIGPWYDDGFRRIQLGPKVLSRMLRWPVSEYQVLVKCEPGTGDSWAFDDDLVQEDRHKTALIATITRDQVIAAYSESRRDEN